MLTQFHYYLQEELEQVNLVDQRVIPSETVSQGEYAMSETHRFSSNQPVNGKISPTLSEKTRPEKMSQYPVQERNVMVYSDEASMANGSNGEPTL